jgi:hypothetical protein
MHFCIFYMVKKTRTGPAMPSSLLNSIFTEAVRKARAGDGRTDGEKMVESFIGLVDAIERTENLPEKAPSARLRELFLAQVNAKLGRVAEGFAEMLSFNGDPPRREGKAWRRGEIFTRPVAGMGSSRLGGKGVPETFHFEQHPPFYLLRHLWMGLPYFIPSEKPFAHLAPPADVDTPVARVGYEDIAAQENFHVLLDMARAANVDITFTYPNVAMVYGGPARSRQINMTQELGEAHLTPSRRPLFRKILVSLDLNKPFSADKYPLSLESLRLTHAAQATKTPSRLSIPRNADAATRTALIEAALNNKTGKKTEQPEQKAPASHILRRAY